MAAQRYATGAAIVAWFGVLLQCYVTVARSLDNGRSVVDGLILFFGFFTVITNLLVCPAFTLPLLARDSAAGRFFAGSFAVAGIATNIAFVALAYHFLLRHVWHPQGAQLLADVLLHYVIPGLFIVYWLAYSRCGSLKWAHPVYWSIYPSVYFVYVLIRGELNGTYPYGFIDVAAIGYQRTMINAVVLLFAVLVLGFIAVWIDRAGRYRKCG